MMILYKIKALLLYIALILLPLLFLPLLAAPFYVLVVYKDALLVGTIGVLMIAESAVSIAWLVIDYLIERRIDKRKEEDK